MIPSRVKNLEPRAFAGCHSLGEASFKEGVETIAGGTFAGCDALAKANFPDSLTAIGAGAFRDCYSLATALLAPQTEVQIDSFSGRTTISRKA